MNTEEKLRLCVHEIKDIVRGVYAEGKRYSPLRETEYESILAAIHAQCDQARDIVIRAAKIGGPEFDSLSACTTWRKLRNLAEALVESGWTFGRGVTAYRLFELLDFLQVEWVWPCLLEAGRVLDAQPK
ncbi:hypothetical protein [Acidithiobacillus sp.]